MNHDQGIFIPQDPITRMRAKKLQQTLYTSIQAMVSSSKKILEDVGDLPYMLCKVDVQKINVFNVKLYLINSVKFTELVMTTDHISSLALFNYNLNIYLWYLN